MSAKHQQKAGKEPHACARARTARLDKHLSHPGLRAWPRVNNAGALGLVTGSAALFNYTLIERPGCR